MSHNAAHKNFKADKRVNIHVFDCTHFHKVKFSVNVLLFKELLQNFQKKIDLQNSVFFSITTHRL
jgi:hypothetical protein